MVPHSFLTPDVASTPAGHENAKVMKASKTTIYRGDGSERHPQSRRPGVPWARAPRIVRALRFVWWSYARLRFAGGFSATALAGRFFCVLTASRLFLSASIRFTTLGGASAVGATISWPAIFASMIALSPS